MGNWNINIQGIGCHHNEGSKIDAQYLAARFVEELRAAGHTIENAEFTSGSKLDIANPEASWHNSVFTKKRD